MNRLRFQRELSPEWKADVLVVDGRYFPAGTALDGCAAAPDASFAWKRRWQKVCRGVRVVTTLARHPAAVLHAHEHGTLFYAWFWRVVLRRRVVWDPHDMYLRTTTHDRQVHRATWKRRWERVLIRCGTPIAVVSEGMRTLYARSFPEARIELLRSFPSGEEERESDVDALIRRRAEAGGGKLRLVYPGLILRTRIETEFLEAVSRSSHLTLDLYGLDPAGRYDRELEDWVRAHAVGNVRLRGPYAPQELPGILAAYHFAVLPFVIDSENMDYCMPNKFYQCMAALLPVVVSEMEDLGREVRTYDLGYVFRPGDYAGAVSRLEALAPGDTGYRDRLLAVRNYRETRMNRGEEQSILESLYRNPA